MILQGTSHTFFSALARLAPILVMTASASFSARHSSLRSSFRALRFASRLFCSSSASSSAPSSCLSCCPLSPISCASHLQTQHAVHVQLEQA